MAVLTKEAENRIIGLLLAEGLADRELVEKAKAKTTDPESSIITDLIAQVLITQDMVSHATAAIIGVPYV